MSLAAQFIFWFVLGILEPPDSPPYVPRRKRKPLRGSHFLRTLITKCTVTITAQVDNVKVRRHYRTPSLPFNGYRHRRKKRKLVPPTSMTGMTMTWDSNSSPSPSQGIFDSDAQALMLDDGASACDTIPSTTPGAEPPRDAIDSGSARSHSTHLETSPSDRPKMVTYTEPQTVSTYISVKCTRRTLRMPDFTRATHAQPSLSDFPWRDSEFWRADPLTRDDPGGTKFSHFPPN